MQEALPEIKEKNAFRQFHVCQKKKHINDIFIHFLMSTFIFFRNLMLHIY